jgi:hypothetical protein
MGVTCSTQGRIRYVHKILVSQPEGKRCLEYLFVDGTIILEALFKTSDIEKTFFEKHDIKKT